MIVFLFEKVSCCAFGDLAQCIEDVTYETDCLEEEKEKYNEPYINMFLSHDYQQFCGEYGLGLSGDSCSGFPSWAIIGISIFSVFIILFLIVALAFHHR